MKQKHPYGIRTVVLLSVFQLLSFFPKLIAQTGTPISGKVLATKTRDALEGASVQITGSTNTVVTDVQGGFRIITYKPLPVTLIITYTGYASTELVVSDDKPVEVLLTESAGELSDVVVVGYGTQ